MANHVEGNSGRRPIPCGDMIHHLGIGDLFVITGQSNSAGYGKDPIFDPPELGIHLLKNNGRWDMASHPFNDSTATIQLIKERIP